MDKSFSIKLFSFSVGQTFKLNAFVWRITDINRTNTQISVMPIIDACGDYIPPHQDLVETWTVRESPTVLKCVKFSDSGIVDKESFINNIQGK